LLSVIGTDCLLKPWRWHSKPVGRNGIVPRSAMNPLPVILALQTPQQTRRLLETLGLRGVFRIEAIVHGETATMHAVQSLLDHPAFPPDETIVVITNVRAADRIPGLCERLLDLFPEVTVVGLQDDTGAIRTYRSSIEVRDFKGPLESLLAGLRHAAP